MEDLDGHALRLFTDRVAFLDWYRRLTARVSQTRHNRWVIASTAMSLGDDADQPADFEPQGG
jgi:hypothetical protein